MVYCGQCGTQVTEGTKFCPNCGAAIEEYTGPSTQPASPLQEYWTNRDATYACADPAAQAVQPVQPVQPVQNIPQNHVNRQQEEQSIQDLIRYFSEKQRQYNEYDAISEALYQPRDRAHKALLVWGIILMAIPLLIGFLVLLIGIAADDAGSGFGISLIFFLLALPGFFMIFGYVRQNNRSKAAYQYNDTRFMKLTDELVQHYNNYEYCPIGFEYSNPSVLQSILNTIHGGRADTSKEAINLLLDAARRQNKRAFAIQRAQSARAAARGAYPPAAFCATAFFTR